MKTILQAAIELASQLWPDTSVMACIRCVFSGLQPNKAAPTVGA